MPMYEYGCPKCGNFEVFRHMDGVRHVEYCDTCGKPCHRIYTPPALQTDTNFMFTGQYDNRLCDGRSDRVEGRKDFQRRLDKKNLQIIDESVFDKKNRKPDLTM